MVGRDALQDAAGRRGKRAAIGGALALVAMAVAPAAAGAALAPLDSAIDLSRPLATQTGSSTYDDSLGAIVAVDVCAGDASPTRCSLVKTFPGSGFSYVGGQHLYAE